VGQDPAFLRAYHDLEVAATVRSSVVLEGETGTGKEQFARALHAMSRRSEQPFVPVHCGSLAESLLQSELFGHERGAFTGALRQKPGRIEQANHGTLFLDEVGDLSPAMQVALLRVLEERCFERVGGTAPREVDLRVVSAAQRDLASLVSQGLFREDLFFRLCVITIYLPPLRDRPMDILPLAHHFLAAQAKALGKTIRGFSRDAERVMLSYSWPGNIRELRNAIEHALAFAEDCWLRPQDFPARIRGERGRSPVPPGLSWKEAQIAILRRALVRHAGNRHAVARELQIDRGTLYSMIRRWRLEDVGRESLVSSCSAGVNGLAPQPPS